MTPQELSRALKTHGITVDQFAAIIGEKRSRVEEWLNPPSSDSYAFQVPHVIGLFFEFLKLAPARDIALNMTQKGASSQQLSKNLTRLDMTLDDFIFLTGYTREQVENWLHPPDMAGSYNAAHHAPRIVAVIFEILWLIGAPEMAYAYSRAMVKPRALDKPKRDYNAPTEATVIKTRPRYAR